MVIEFVNLKIELEMQQITCGLVLIFLLYGLLCCCHCCLQAAWDNNMFTWPVLAFQEGKKEEKVTKPIMQIHASET